LGKTAALILTCAGAALAGDVHWPPFNDKLELHYEFRLRYENRVAQTFGLGVDQDYILLRSRMGLVYKPSKSVHFAVTGQDIRSPLLGAVAPGSASDHFDLHEVYTSIRPGAKSGFSATLGRQRVSLGDGRLIGTPEWVNFGRVYDGGRASYTAGRARFEGLFLSVVRPRTEVFNTPILGDRLWGTYSSFHDVIPKTEVEWYILRHDVNRPGGFTEPGTQGVSTFGTRVAGPLGAGFRFIGEGALQGGHWGLRKHRAGGGVFHVARELSWPLPVEASVEYKYASGTEDFGSDRHSTFDQLYAAVHNRTGHADLFGWVNIHNIQAQADIDVAPQWVVTLMYDNSWLASATDYAYTAQGRPIVRSPDGSAGRHLGAEFGIYTGWRRGHFTIGGGFAYLWAGEFIRNTTPGVNTRFWYLTQGFSF
jgi:hypothetical protein